MSITCFIRYRIEPTKHAQFEEYARNWRQCIPSCGADLVGYFAPHEVSSTIAFGAYHLDSLAHYQAYRAKLKTHPLGKVDYEFAQAEKFLLQEDRLFLRLASAPHAPLATS